MRGFFFGLTFIPRLVISLIIDDYSLLTYKKNLFGL